MKKEIEEKICTLSRIRPDEEFKENFKARIMKREDSFKDVFSGILVFRGSLFTAGVLALLFFIHLFTPSAFPSNYKEYLSIENEKKDEGVGVNKEKVEEIRKDLATLENDLRSSQNEVLRMLVGREGEGLSDEEIINHHLTKIESSLTIEEEGKKEEKVKEARKALEESNKGEALDSIIEILSEESRSIKNSY